MAGHVIASYETPGCGHGAPADFCRSFPGTALCVRDWLLARGMEQRVAWCEWSKLARGARRMLVLSRQPALPLGRP